MCSTGMDLSKQIQRQPMLMFELTDLFFMIPLTKELLLKKSELNDKMSTFNLPAFTHFGERILLNGRRAT